MLKLVILFHVQMTRSYIFYLATLISKAKKIKDMLYQKSHLSNVVFQIYHNLISLNTKVLSIDFEPWEILRKILFRWPQSDKT